MQRCHILMRELENTVAQGEPSFGIDSVCYGPRYRLSYLLILLTHVAGTHAPHAMLSVVINIIY